MKYIIRKTFVYIIFIFIIVFLHAFVTLNVSAHEIDEHKNKNIKSMRKNIDDKVISLIIANGWDPKFCKTQKQYKKDKIIVIVKRGDKYGTVYKGGEFHVFFDIKTFEVIQIKRFQ